MDKILAKKLVTKAIEQLSEGLDAKKDRMATVKTIIDLYNNKQINLSENDENQTDVMNIPFAIMAKQIDSYYSKIDEPPTLNFKIPNRKNLSEKIKQAWIQESSSTRGGWARKDRAEKKGALLSGRGIAQIYSTSVKNKYNSHYDVVDVYNFIADPGRGYLEAGKYHGEVNIVKTKTWLKKMVKKGIYDSKQVEQLFNWNMSTAEDGVKEAIDKQKERLSSLNVKSTKNLNDGYNLVQWIMKHEEVWYYLLFDMGTGIYVRCEELKEVTASGKTPYVSWAVNYDEYAFWTKGVGDDILPSAEAIKFLLNNALENEKRRSRPMRMIAANAVDDINELIDYVPDNVIVSRAGAENSIVTIDTPEIKTTIQLAEFFNNFMESKSGVGGQGTDKPDTKVGIYYGELAQDADLIGTVNKEYSESYAGKGYRFFWGLKKDLTEVMSLEMLGKGGIKLMELSRMELSDVGDVDDVEVSGGAREQEVDAVKSERQAKAIADLSSAYPSKLSPDWVIKTRLKSEEFTDEDIQQALDVDSVFDQELMNEADEAIQQILLGNTPKLNNGATVAFMERILNYATSNLDWVKLDKKGNETGIDRRKKEQFDNLLAYMAAHQQVAIDNGQKNLRELEAKQMISEVGGNPGGVDPQQTTIQEQRLALARPGETTIPQGTLPGTAQASARIAETVTP